MPRQMRGTTEEEPPGLGPRFLARCRTKWLVVDELRSLGVAQVLHCALEWVPVNMTCVTKESSTTRAPTLWMSRKWRSPGSRCSRALTRIRPRRSSGSSTTPRPTSSSRARRSPRSTGSASKRPGAAPSTACGTTCKTSTTSTTYTAGTRTWGTTSRCPRRTRSRATRLWRRTAGGAARSRCRS